MKNYIKPISLLLIISLLFYGCTTKTTEEKKNEATSEMVPSTEPAQEEEFYNLASTYLEVESVYEDLTYDNSAVVEIKSNSATPEQFIRAMAYIYTKNFSLKEPYSSLTFIYKSDRIKEGKCSLFLLQEYGDYYDGTEILPANESDEECLSEKDLLERMFKWTFQIKACGTCNYFWIFTHFDPSVDCMISENICNITYTCS